MRDARARSLRRRDLRSNVSKGSGGLQGIQFDKGFRADIVIERHLIVEIKAVSNIVAAHEAQVLTYLRMSGLRPGLLFDLHARLLKDGMRRLVV